MQGGKATDNGPVASGEGPGHGLLGPRTRNLLTPRTRNLLRLEFGSKEQFDDPRPEWRRLFSELLGTIAGGSGVLDERSLAAKQQLSGAIDRGEVVPPGIAGTETPKP
jgi:hypothetical protein